MDAVTIRLWSLTEDTLVELGDDGSLTVVTWWGEIDLTGTAEPVRDSLRRMALGPVSMANVPASGQPVGERWLAGLSNVLNRLSGSVVHSLALDDGLGPLLSAIPVTLSPVFPADPVPVDRPVKLSRFAALRPDGGSLFIESPAARYRVALLQPAAVLVASSLAAPATITEVTAATGVAPGVVADVVAFLVSAGVVAEADGRGSFAEDDDPELALWGRDDLMFHARSRTWTDRTPPDPAGGTAPPVVKLVSAGPTVPLHRPELGEAPSLTELLETDHTCPEFTGRELDAEQLGEFLFRAARVRSVGPAHLPARPSHEASQRPYFSIGCLYELEIYVSVNRCTGLDRGIYHYDPLWHALTLINDDAAELDAMLDMAMVAGASHRQPPVLLTVTARMSRIAQVLGGAAYATTLLHLGALQQVLYLTAKAMRLAAHAVPVDAGDRVDRALKLEWPAEVGVGECVLDFAS